MHFKVGRPPFFYLGMPLGANLRKTSMWKLIVKRFRDRLVGWKGRMLSMGGRVILINSTLLSLPLYYMSLFKASKCMIKKLDLMRNFL
ncbi:hypothetical protein POUND7_001789 [Theobroma cacao]